MTTKAKRGWGQVNQADPAKDDGAPAPKKVAVGGFATVLLQDLDVAKLSVGSELKEGANNSKYLELFYEGKRFELAICKLPDYVRSPFKCAAYTDKETGKVINSNHSISVELAPAQLAKYRELEAWLCDSVSAFREEAFPPKNGMAKATTHDDFVGKFNTLVKQHGEYPPTLRIAVSHEPVDENGKARKLPNLQKCHLREDAITRPVPAKVTDLVSNAAIVPVASFTRNGVYFTTTGWGVKLTLQAAHILSNMTAASGSQVDTSSVKVLDEETPEDDDDVHAAKSEDEEPKSEKEE